MCSCLLLIFMCKKDLHANRPYTSQRINIKCYLHLHSFTSAPQNIMHWPCREHKWHRHLHRKFDINGAIKYPVVFQFLFTFWLQHRNKLCGVALYLFGVVLWSVPKNGLIYFFTLLGLYTGQMMSTVWVGSQ